MVGQDDFGMHDTAFARVVMRDSVVFVRDGFARTVSRRRDSGLALAAADDLNAVVIDCHDCAPFVCDGD
jgi:hypothetical protein